MAVIEARGPNGQIIELTEVNLSKSGLLIMIMDTNGNQASIHRFAWKELVQTVETMLATSSTYLPPPQEH